MTTMVAKPAINLLIIVILGSDLIYRKEHSVVTNCT